MRACAGENCEYFRFRCVVNRLAVYRIPDIAEANVLYATFHFSRSREIKERIIRSRDRPALPDFLARAIYNVVRSRTQTLQANRGYMNAPKAPPQPTGLYVHVLKCLHA